MGSSMLTRFTTIGTMDKRKTRTASVNDLEPSAYALRAEKTISMIISAFNMIFR